LEILDFSARTGADGSCGEAVPATDCHLVAAEASRVRASVGDHLTWTDPKLFRELSHLVA
jgi:hypothetical protein